MEITTNKPNEEWEKFTSGYSDSEKFLVIEHAENIVTSKQFSSNDIKVYFDEQNKASYIYVRSSAKKRCTYREKNAELVRTERKTYFRRNA